MTIIQRNNNRNNEQGAKVLDHAALFASFGWSLIPLRDKSQPAVAWKWAQARRADLHEVARWLTDSQIMLGIVTGAISRLMVLDIDDPTLYNKFTKQHHKLANTLTIRTARGYHLYFTTPAGADVPSQTGQGVDLQGEGRYVVAPYSTRPDGTHYQRHSGSKPLLLSLDDIKRVMAFVERTHPTDATQPIQTITSGTAICSEAEIVTLYRYLVSDDRGRNNALFAAACHARDHHRPQRWSEAALVSHHVAAPPPPGHVVETNQQRIREARATIASAYSKPARAPLMRRSSYKQVPNVAREALIERECDTAAQLLDALYARFGVGAVLSLAEVRHVLRDLMSDYAIRSGWKVLKTHHIIVMLCNKFCRGYCECRRRLPGDVADSKATNSPNPSRPKLINHTAYGLDGINHHHLSRQTYNCDLYQVPNPVAVCAALGIPFNPVSDALALEDLRSPSAYRQALLDSFVERRPGQHTQSFLARKLGVCTRTIRNYCQQLGIVIHPMETQTAIGWHNIKTVPLKPPESDAYGVYLRLLGQVYPPVRAIAIKALKRGYTPILCHRGPNHYSKPEAQITVTTPGQSAEELAATHSAQKRPDVQDAEPAAPLIARPAQRPKQLNMWPKEIAGHNSYTIERIATQAHQAIAGLSLKNALAIAKRTGVLACIVALHKVQQRNGVRNEAGLFRSIAIQEMEKRKNATTNS